MGFSWRGTAGRFGELRSSPENCTRGSMKLYVIMSKFDVITRKNWALKSERYYCLCGSKVGYIYSGSSSVHQHLQLVRKPVIIFAYS